MQNTIFIYLFVFTRVHVQWEVTIESKILFVCTVRSSVSQFCATYEFLRFLLHIFIITSNIVLILSLSFYLWINIVCCAYNLMVSVFFSILLSQKNQANLVGCYNWKLAGELNSKVLLFFLQNMATNHKQNRCNANAYNGQVFSSLVYVRSKQFNQHPLQNW